MWRMLLPCILVATASMMDLQSVYAYTEMKVLHIILQSEHYWFSLAYM